MNVRRISIALLSFALVLAACKTPTGATTEPQATNSSNPTPNATSSSPTELNANITLDPAITTDGDSLRVATYIYSGLVTLDASGTPQPAVAESWVISDDKLDYIFNIRPGATFSDGTPITPDVVVDNFNRWFDPKSPLRGSGTYAEWEKIFLGFHGEKTPDNLPKSTVDGIQKVDVNTVLVHLNKPVTDLLQDLADPAFSILDTTQLQGGSYGTRGSTIVSSGPYVVSDWTATGLTLSPNSKYWDTPPTQTLTFTLH